MELFEINKEQNLNLFCPDFKPEDEVSISGFRTNNFQKSLEF